MSDPNTNPSFGTSIETLDCHFVDVMNPRLEDIRIEDIAHALANQCRFNGYTSRHYSVAEHSVYVARYVAAELDWRDAWYVKGWHHLQRHEAVRSIARQALLHDATEAYLIDLPRPVKRAIPQYKVIEDALWAILAKRFDVPVVMHPAIKEADMRICATEKMVLMSDKGFDRPEWKDLNQNYKPYTGAEDIIDRWPVGTTIPHSVIKKRFLDFYETVREA